MRLVLLGGGGHAGAVADVARSAGFTVSGVLTPDVSTGVPGLTRLGDDEWIEAAPADTGFHLAFGPQPGHRWRDTLFERFLARGAMFPVIVASSAVVSPSAVLGAGSIAMHATVINAAAHVGKNCIINTRSVVEHHCTVGDHTHIAPGALLCGGVRVGMRCLIGTGAVVLPGVSIADGVVIGAGAIVVGSIDEGEVWFGNPARRHK